MAGQITANSVQLGDSATATQNFTLRTNADGTATLARGNVGATTQDVLTVNASGQVTLTQGLAAMPTNATPASMVRLNTANGYGSTNTKIRRFTNVVTNQGSDITYADSATLGASFTINTNGVYAISYSEKYTTAGEIGVSLNTATPTTQLSSCAISEILIYAISDGANFAPSCGITQYLPLGSIIRPHNSGIASSGALQFFTITRVS